ncbi:MAG TPA: hypothetical protein VE465_24570 [Streptosporangiaceae bacterium]|nr:hypothetical protein [Streptosporangiaceae bacterium]
MSEARARIHDARILEEDGPHEVWFDPDDFAAPGQVAAAASADPDMGIGSYAAVLGTARRALVGVFAATQVTHEAAVLVALARGLARLGEGERVEVLVQQAQLRQRLRHRMFARKEDLGCSFGGVLVYRWETSLVRRHLRALHATFPDVPAGPGGAAASAAGRGLPAVVDHLPARRGMRPA